MLQNSLIHVTIKVQLKWLHKMKPVEISLPHPPSVNYSLFKTGYDNHPHLYRVRNSLFSWGVQQAFSFARRLEAISTIWVVFPKNFRKVYGTSWNTKSVPKQIQGAFNSDHCIYSMLYVILQTTFVVRLNRLNWITHYRNIELKTLYNHCRE